MRDYGKIEVFHYNESSKQYDKGFTKSHDWGLCFFLIMLVFIIAGISQVITVYTGQLDIIEGGSGRVLMIIAFIGGPLGIVVFALASRASNKKFLIWLVERYKSQYPEMGRIMEEQGIKYQNKQLEKLLGQAIREEHDKLFPGQAYDYDWFYNDYIFQGIYKPEKKGEEPTLPPHPSKEGKEYIEELAEGNYKENIIKEKEPPSPAPKAEGTESAPIPVPPTPQLPDPAYQAQPYSSQMHPVIPPQPKKPMIYRDQYGRLINQYGQFVDPYGNPIPIQPYPLQYKSPVQSTEPPEEKSQDILKLEIANIIKNSSISSKKNRFF